jgi:hypothetical protein
MIRRISVGCACARGEQWVGDVYAHELRRADGGYRQVSLWEVKLCRALAQKREGVPGDWLGYVSEVEAMTEQRQAEKKRVWRQRERAAGVEREESRAGEGEPLGELSDEALSTRLLADFES